MKQTIVNIARLNLCRTIWHKISAKYSDADCYAAFVEAMNTQAKEWGMEQTHWINPSGLGVDGLYSRSAANDMSVMAIRAFVMGGVKFIIRMDMRSR